MGLRGGIAFSLTKLVPPNLLPQIHQMLSACIAVILFTSFVQGASIGPLVDWLKIKKAEPGELPPSNRASHTTLTRSTERLHRIENADQRHEEQIVLMNDSKVDDSKF